MRASAVLKERGGRQQHLWSGEGVSSIDGVVSGEGISSTDEVVRASAALMKW